eukprot:352048-Chlamydomonas_euryale.AAC.12
MAAAAQAVILPVGPAWNVLHVLPAVGRACVLAHPAAVLVHPLCGHDEAANTAHDQVPIRSLHAREEGASMCFKLICA